MIDREHQVVQAQIWRGLLDHCRMSGRSRSRPRPVLAWIAALLGLLVMFVGWPLLVWLHHNHAL
jgi:hypothetical protein